MWLFRQNEISSNGVVDHLEDEVARDGSAPIEEDSQADEEQDEEEASSDDDVRGFD